MALVVALFVVHGRDVPSREWLGHADVLRAGNHEVDGSALVKNQHGGGFRTPPNPLRWWFPYMTAGRDPDAADCACRFARLTTVFGR
jgi:hypothetical protein